jgi:hypothetical protein
VKRQETFTRHEVCYLNPILRFYLIFSNRNQTKAFLVKSFYGKNVPTLSAFVAKKKEIFFDKKEAEPFNRELQRKRCKFLLIGVVCFYKKIEFEKRSGLLFRLRCGCKCSERWIGSGLLFLLN